MSLIECRGANIGPLAVDNYEYGDRWNESCGPEMVHKYLIPQVKLDDRVLDLYSGYGRASIPLLMAGAKITLVDNSYEALNRGIELLEKAKIRDQVEMMINKDARYLKSSEVGKFKFVLAVDAIVHMMKSDSFDFVKKLPSFLEDSGGFIYINAPSKLSWTYENAVLHSKRIDNLDTFEELCGCSGENKLEPVSFYMPGELESALKNCGGKIIEARAIETYSLDNFIWSIVARF